jgi:hypothetical protein
MFLGPNEWRIASDGQTLCGSFIKLSIEFSRRMNSYVTYINIMPNFENFIINFFKQFEDSVSFK